MATAEAETSQDERGAPGGLVYDGFISYSHAADDLLAPRLQAGLQRFAKPWWKRRALRIFRDEASLSANPHLWSSITDALDQSDWFVLLLSPDAAESPWVNNEVEYWLEHRDADRIIPVVTGGEFTWSESDIDLESTAAPPALYGAFSDEPRWVDLRFARTDEQLDLNNPRFSAAVADIASAIRGVPKDELESEEVLQHRRTVRTAWAAGGALLLLALVAGAAAVYAIDQRNETEQQRIIAEENADEADAQRDIAEENESVAEAAAAAEAEARREAERSALLAGSNELALRAEKEIPVDAERAMLLAIEAIGLARQAGIEPVEASRSLRNALTSSRIVHRLSGGDFVAVALDGSMLATVSDQGLVGSQCEDAGIPTCPVTVWDTTTWELIATFTEAGGRATEAGFSPSGDRLAVTFVKGDPGAQVSAVVVYDLAGGPEVRLEGDTPPESGGQVQFAGGGDLIVAHLLDENGPGVGVWSADTGEMLARHDNGSFTVDPSGERLAIVSGFGDGRLRIHDLRTGEALLDVGGSEFSIGVSFSPDGTLVAETSQERTRLLIRDTGSGEVLYEWQVDRISGGTWLDGSRIAVGGEGSTRIVDIETGGVLFELAGHTSVVWKPAAIPGTNLIATAGFDGTVLIWDTSPDGLTELPIWDTGLPDSGFFFARPDGGLALVPRSETGESLWWLADDGSPAVLVMDDLVQSRPAQEGTLLTFIGLDGTSGVVSVPDGEVVYRSPPGREVHGTNNDATLVVLQEPLDDARRLEQVPVIIETDTGTEVGRLPPPGVQGFQFSPDSSLVFTFCCGTSSVYLLPGAEPTGFIVGFAARITDDGSILAYPPNWEGDIWLLDTEKLKATGDIESARVAEISAHSNFIFPDFSDDGTKLLTTTFDEPIKVWDISGVLDGREPTLIAEIDAEPRSGPPAAYFRPNGTHIVSRSVDGLLRLFTIDTGELIGIAQSRLTRALTSEECATFGIDPCTTLDEIKASAG